MLFKRQGDLVLKRIEAMTDFDEVRWLRLSYSKLLGDELGLSVVTESVECGLNGGMQ